MFYSAPSGLVLFCRDHVPPGFVQDPLSLLWVPEDLVSPLFLLLQKWQEMKTAARILANYVEKTVRERERLAGLEGEICESVRRLKERLAKRVCLQEDGAGGLVLHVDRWGMPAWLGEREGVRVVAAGVRAGHALLATGGCGAVV